MAWAVKRLSSLKMEVTKITPKKRMFQSMEIMLARKLKLNRIMSHVPALVLSFTAR